MAAEGGIGPPLYDAAKWFCRKPRPTHAALASTSGVPAADATDAIDNMHALLNKLTNGQTMSFSQHVQRDRDNSCQATPFLDNVPRHPDGMISPTLVCARLAAAKRGKALGPAFEAPELCRAIPQELTALFDPLVQKACLTLIGPSKLGDPKLFSSQRIRQARVINTRTEGPYGWATRCPSVSVPLSDPWSAGMLRVLLLLVSSAWDGTVLASTWLM